MEKTADRKKTVQRIVSDTVDRKRTWLFFRERGRQARLNNGSCQWLEQTRLGDELKECPVTLNWPVEGDRGRLSSNPSHLSVAGQMTRGHFDLAVPQQILKFGDQQTTCSRFPQKTSLSESLALKSPGPFLYLYFYNSVTSNFEAHFFFNQRILDTFLCF